MTAVRASLFPNQATEISFTPSPNIPASDTQWAIEVPKDDIDALSNAQFIVAASTDNLSSERVVTNSNTISWNVSVTGQILADLIDNSVNTAHIRDAVVTFAKFQNIATDVFAAALTAIAFQSSATSSASTITAPADIIAGDLLVLVDAPLNSSTTMPTSVVPGGFTSIVETTVSAPIVGPSFRMIASYKLATGSEASTSLTGVTGDSPRKTLVVFRPNVPASTYTSADPGGEGTTGNPVAQTVTASGGTPPLVVFGTYRSGNAINPRTMSPAKDSEIDNGTFLFVAWKIYNSSPADVSVDMDDEGTQVLQSFYITAA